jgi:hypothetical protein
VAEVFALNDCINSPSTPATPDGHNLSGVLLIEVFKEVTVWLNQ